ncbi:MAG: hypothetical protein C5B50_04130 [Verrucomicrobia bacterium]|nr:MAG: hypothetical protein C5B50_04130 [Verrucomicrobiota bacterium]
MPLSFLNPWFWLAALAVVAPIWLHLRRKRETHLIRFSALRFLDDQPQPRQGPMRLRDLLLFALRVLALLAVVGAFAWPFLRGANTAPIQESRVYILDNTLSHQAGGGFTRDKARILTDLDNVGPSIQVAVIELISSPQIVVTFADSRESARQKLRELEPSHQRGSFLAAFRQASSLLANSLGEKKRVVFLSDSQENQWTENVNTPPFLRDMEVELPKAPSPALPNLWLSEPRAQRIFLGDKSLINFTVKLGHTGPATSANVALRANGQLIFNRTVDLEKAPESIVLQAQWEASPTAWLRGGVTVDGKPDALAEDNRVFFSLAPVVEGKVALLAQSPWLRLALSPEIMRGQWAVRMLDPANLSAELEENVGQASRLPYGTVPVPAAAPNEGTGETPALSSDADVLCIESSYLQSSQARKLLWRYLANGRGVLLLVNRLTPSVEGFLRELGFESEGTVTASKENPEKFQFVFSSHPIFHPFLSPDYGNLMDIKVWQYARLKAPQAMPLIFSERGAGLFFQSQKLQGKLFVAAFGMDREHSSWPIHQTFIPFLDLALQAARAEDPTPTSFEPAEIALIQLPTGSNAREAVLRDANRELLRAPVDQGHVQVRMPSNPGLYDLAYDEHSEVAKVFSVNPSPKESELVFSESPDAMRVWKYQTRAGVSPVQPKLANLSASAILQQRLWWWMVLAGLVFLLLEMALAEARKERA